MRKVNMRWEYICGETWDHQKIDGLYLYHKKEFDDYIGSGSSELGGMLYRAAQHDHLYKREKRRVFYRVSTLCSWPPIVPGAEETLDKIRLMEAIWQTRLSTGRNQDGKHATPFFRALQLEYNKLKATEPTNKLGGLNIRCAIEKDERFRMSF